MNWSGAAGSGLGRHGSGGPDGSKGHEAEEIRSILTRWMKRSRIRERLGNESIFGRWAEIVGEEIAGMTRPIRIAGGILTVEVTSPPLLQELSTFRRREILESVRSRPEFLGIREIRFRAGNGGGRSGQPQPTSDDERERAKRRL